MPTTSNLVAAATEARARQATREIAYYDSVIQRLAKIAEGCDVNGIDFCTLARDLDWKSSDDMLPGDTCGHTVLTSPDEVVVLHLIDGNYARLASIILVNESFRT